MLTCRIMLLSLLLLSLSFLHWRVSLSLYSVSQAHSTNQSAFWLFTKSRRKTMKEEKKKTFCYFPNTCPSSFNRRPVAALSRRSTKPPITPSTSRLVTFSGGAEPHVAATLCFFPLFLQRLNRLDSLHHLS